MPKSQLKFKIEDFNILHDNVLVKAIDITERDEIIKPQQYDDKPELGEVIITGPGRVLESGSVVPLTVKKGDTVYFNKYSTVKFNFDGNDYHVVREEDIVGFIR